jgi:hypothetical protein
VIFLNTILGGQVCSLWEEEGREGGEGRGGGGRGEGGEEREGRRGVEEGRGGTEEGNSECVGGANRRDYGQTCAR